MDAFLQSLGLVLASEMGDKTQLLALILVLRFKKPWAIMAGILVATLANHAAATWIGSWLAGFVSPDTLKIILGLTFIAFGFWILIPDKIENDETSQPNKYGAFLTTTLLFFLAEMGDKTQLATLALGARFQMPLAVTSGTTIGMLIADGLAVVFGERLTRVVPLKVVRVFSCILFLTSGIGILVLT